MPDYRSGHYDALHAEIGRYYSAKIGEHGATPKGVDWRDAASQALRFDKLMAIHVGTEPFSLAEYGCGYGALYDHCRAAGLECRYQGFDLSAEMIEAARARHRDAAQAEFFVGREPKQPADYCVASGIFNVCGDAEGTEWRALIEATLISMHAWCRRGFAFNILTAHSDADKQRPDLYYADPGDMLNACLRRFGRHVSLMHDYALYEFTVLVRKPVDT